MLGTNIQTTFTQCCLNVVWTLWNNIVFNVVAMLWQHRKTTSFSNVVATLLQRYTNAEATLPQHCDITFTFNIVAMWQQCSNGVSGLTKLNIAWMLGVSWVRSRNYVATGRVLPGALAVSGLGIMRFLNGNGFSLSWVTGCWETAIPDIPFLYWFRH